MSWGKAGKELGSFLNHHNLLTPTSCHCEPPEIGFSSKERNPFTAFKCSILSTILSRGSGFQFLSTEVAPIPAIGGASASPQPQSRHSRDTKLRLGPRAA